MNDVAPAEVEARLKALGLFGLLGNLAHIADKPWLGEVLAIEERERQKRGLERRLRNARVASFKSITDFDWAWPKRIDREAIEELFTLGFLKSGHNAVIIGPNGVGKTMIIKNIAQRHEHRRTSPRPASSSEERGKLAAPNRLRPRCVPVRRREHSVQGRSIRLGIPQSDPVY